MTTLKSNLDDIDWQILQELQTNARLSYAEIGRRVSLSSPAVQERVRRMEEEGIITGYHATVNYKKLGLDVYAYSRLINVAKDSEAEIERIANSSPEIIDFLQVMGEDWYFARIVARSVEHLNAVRGRFQPYAQTVTSVIIKQVVPRRILTPANLDFHNDEEER